MKFVVRVLSVDDELLGWAAVVEVSIARGLIRPASPVPIVIERDGEASALSIQWTDLDVARVQPLTPVAVTAGSTVTCAEPLWRVVGDTLVPLPPVTVRQSTILTPETAALGSARVT